MIFHTLKNQDYLSALKSYLRTTDILLRLWSSAQKLVNERKILSISVESKNNCLISVKPIKLYMPSKTFLIRRNCSQFSMSFARQIKVIEMYIVSISVNTEMPFHSISSQLRHLRVHFTLLLTRFCWFDPH